MSGEQEIGFQFLAENSTDVVCRAGLDLTLHYASPSSFLVLGWEPREMLSRRLDTFVLEDDAAAFTAALAASHTSGAGSPAVIVRMLKKDGTVAWVELKQCLLRDTATGLPTEVIAVLRDVAGRRPMTDILAALALTDSLTGLSTHHAFLKALEREWNSASRTGSPISLVRLNFNEFRHLGAGERHEKDSCLRRAAAAVLSALRVTDLAARYGGEDIAIILPFTDPGGAAKVAEKVRTAVQCVRSPGHTDAYGPIEVSMGVATAHARSGGAMKIPELLLLAADHALRKAQQQRQNDVSGRTPLDRAAPSADWKMSMPGAPHQCA